MYIIGIDVGLVNMGFALYNTDTGQFEIAKRVQLASKKKEMKTRDELIHRAWTKLFNDHKAAFDKADAVVIERQMKTLYIVIENMIASMLFMLKKEYIIVSPIKVKKMFSISCGNYKQNKNSAVETITHYYPHIVNHVTTKVDDICDAMLLCLFYSNHLDGIHTVSNPAAYSGPPPIRTTKTKKTPAKTAKPTAKRKRSKSPAKQPAKRQRSKKIST